MRVTMWRSVKSIVIAMLLTGANATQMVVYLKDPYAPVGAAAVAVDELRLSHS